MDLCIRMVDCNSPAECIVSICNCSARNSLCKCIYVWSPRCVDTVLSGRGTFAALRIWIFHGSRNRYAPRLAADRDLLGTSCTFYRIDFRAHIYHNCHARNLERNRKLAVHIVHLVSESSFCDDSNTFDACVDSNTQQELHLVQCIWSPCPWYTSRYIYIF